MSVRDPICAQESTRVALTGGDLTLNLSLELELTRAPGEAGRIRLKDLLQSRFDVYAATAGEPLHYGSAEDVILAGWRVKPAPAAWPDGFPEGFNESAD